MKFVIPFLLLLLSGDVGTPRDKAHAVRVPEVRGFLATPVWFSDAASQKVADAGLAMLKSCHYDHHPNEGAMPEWDDILSDCTNKKVYLYIRLPEVTEIKTAAEKKVRVTEMIVVLRGNIWVRSGDKAVEYGKYERDKVIRLQRALKEAEAVK